MNEIVVQHNRLLQSTEPKETKAVEEFAAAGRAWAKEHQDYDSYVEYARLYVLARRKTTELVKPFIQQGGHNKKQPDEDVQLLDNFGFTYKQWNRRCKELNLTIEQIDGYFEECASNGWWPSINGLLKQGGPNVSYNTGDSEWYTPPEYIRAARDVMGVIDCDPATSEKANKIIKAETYYTKETNGLDKDWRGCVWLNPPYSSELIGEFIYKYMDEIENGNIKEAIVLINNATDTGWFENLVSVSNAIIFSYGRIKFMDPLGNPGAPLQGQAFVYYGPNVDKFFDEFQKFGWCAWLRKAK